MGHNPEFDVFMTRDNKNPTEIGERRSDHSMASRFVVPMPKLIRDREGVMRAMWMKLDESTFLFSQSSCDHLDFPRRPDVVTVAFRRTIKLTKVGPKLTTLAASASVDLGGRIPRRINDTVTIPCVGATAVGVIQYFTCVRPADSFDEGDGTMLGRLLFVLLHPHRQNREILNEKLLDIIRSTNVLRSAQAKYR
jgi:hypothetical protein